MDWVCWFSTLLWEVCLRVLRFFPLIKNQHLIWFVKTDCKIMIWAMLIWFPLEFAFDHIHMLICAIEILKHYHYISTSSNHSYKINSHSTLVVSCLSSCDFCKTNNRRVCNRIFREWKISLTSFWTKVSWLKVTKWVCNCCACWLPRLDATTRKRESSAASRVDFTVFEKKK